MKSILLFCAITLLAGCQSAPKGSDAVSGASASGGVSARDVGGLEPVNGGKKVLVAYFSQGANTRRVAEDFQRLLGADIERIVERTDRSGPFGFLSAGADSSMGKPGDIEPPARDPSAYDVVLVCTPVWAWNVSPPVRAYLTLVRDRLPAVAFVTVSAATDPEAIVKTMEGIAGKAAIGYTGFVDADFTATDRSGYVEKIRGLLKAFR